MFVTVPPPPTSSRYPSKLTNVETAYTEGVVSREMIVHGEGGERQRSKYQGEKVYCSNTVNMNELDVPLTLYKMLAAIFYTSSSWLIT